MVARGNDHIFFALGFVHANEKRAVLFFVNDPVILKRAPKRVVADPEGSPVFIDQQVKNPAAVCIPDRAAHGPGKLVLQYLSCFQVLETKGKTFRPVQVFRERQPFMVGAD